MQKTIALLTDFGTSDTYVGVMKGVIAGICPDARVIDLTHEVNPQAIRQGAFMLLGSYQYFPAGTIFVVIVDPGVGSWRRSIAAFSDTYSFVAPDNGVLSYTLAENDIQSVTVLENSEYFLNRVSQSFHGRDIYAPIAAHLASGVSREALGRTVEDYVRLSNPRLTVKDEVIYGEVIHIDHFGNIITSMGGFEWQGENLQLRPRFMPINREIIFHADKAVSVIGAQTFEGIQRTYAKVSSQQALVMIGSSGYLELAINQGNFAEMYGIEIGMAVELRFNTR